MASDGQKMNKIKILHFSGTCSEGGRGGGGGVGESNYRERKSNFSLHFLAFGPSVRVRPKKIQIFSKRAKS